MTSFTVSTYKNVRAPAAALSMQQMIGAAKSVPLAALSVRHCPQRQLSSLPFITKVLCSVALGIALSW
jgi:hypothetical protein